MISRIFPNAKEEEAQPFDENLVNQLSKEDQRRLRGARLARQQLIVIHCVFTGFISFYAHTGRRLSSHISWIF